MEWQDAGEALDNEALKGCHMPKGIPSNVLQATQLMYNEVRSDTSPRLNKLLAVFCSTSSMTPRRYD
jgi:poly [ADP-ribose] polymerase